MPMTDDDGIRTLLQDTRTIALIGASDRPDRPSYRVMATLQAHGYRVIPVNPTITGEHLHGEFVFRELAQLGGCQQALGDEFGGGGDVLGLGAHRSRTRLIWSA
mgnify:CR=1 FL=1